MLKNLGAYFLWMPFSLCRPTQKIGDFVLKRLLARPQLSRPQLTRLGNSRGDRLLGFRRAPPPINCRISQYAPTIRKNTTLMMSSRSASSGGGMNMMAP